jgi:hypothetical protein
MRCLRLALIFLSVILGLSVIAFADDDDPQAMRKKSVERSIAKLHELEAALQSENSGLPELQAYLWYAMNAVYTAKVQANWDFGPDLETTNLDMTSLVGLGYLPEWPANPYDFSQPMKVLKPGDPLTPGDLLFCLCPPTYNTTVKGRSYAVSFDLFVVGADGLPEGARYFGQDAENKEWSKPPAQAWYGLSYWQESDRYYQARLEKQKKAEGKPE